MNGWDILGFSLFVGVCSWLTGWALTAGQRAVDRIMGEDLERRKRARRIHLLRKQPP